MSVRREEPSLMTGSLPKNSVLRGEKRLGEKAVWCRADKKYSKTSLFSLRLKLVQTQFLKRPQ